MTTTKKKPWGGRRRGAGRRPGPPEQVRRNRVTFTVTDSELALLTHLAEKKDLPVGTLAYQVVRGFLRRSRQ